ncbi:MAG TPA: DUF2269 family protein [Mycobacteriales bacterium]|nr:DUF2269 family protein [Mycobacteriales bacterium]
MEKLLLTLHVVAAIFLIGPLVAAVNQAPRALRSGDAGALGPLARTVTIYGWVSLVIAVFGAGLVQDKYHNSWSDPWVIISLALFVFASALVLALLAPLLRQAAAAPGGGAELAARAAALGGVASLCYLAIAVLMVTQPGG